MDRPRIREARAGDLDVVARLIGDFQDEGNWPRGGLHASTRAAIEAGRATGSRVFVAEGADGALGFASTWFAIDLGDGPGVWLSDLYVAPAARRRGVGRALLAAAAAAARADGAVWMMWHVGRENDDARAFYASIGAHEKPEHVVVSLGIAPLDRIAAECNDVIAPAGEPPSSPSSR
jgi:GNAT superfamily N-acetyltransferase